MVDGLEGLFGRLWGMGDGEIGWLGWLGLGSIPGIMLFTRLIALCLLVATSVVAAERKPNLIFILADDLGYGDLGCYGQKLIQTPHLDRMAAEGMRFTQFYAGSTVCAPSRSVLMTGLHTGHTRVRGNAGTVNPLAQSLRPGDMTVARALKAAGYATALIGKWGLGDEGEAAVGLPTRQGFDYFFGYANQHHAHNYYPDFLMRGEEQVKLRNKVAPGSADNPVAKRFGVGYASEKVEYSHDLIAAEGLKWVEQNQDRPFFLYFALTTPHANNEANRDLKNGQEVPDFGIYADKDWSPQNKGQAAMISRMDRDIGRLFELLKKLKLEEHTLVMFSSDNGPHNEGGHTPELFQPSGPLRGMKRSLTDGGIRAVPRAVAGEDQARRRVQPRRLVRGLVADGVRVGGREGAGADGWVEPGADAAREAGAAGEAQAFVLGVPRARVQPGGADGRALEGHSTPAHGRAGGTLRRGE